MTRKYLPPRLRDEDDEDLPRGKKRKTMSKSNKPNRLGRKRVTEFYDEDFRPSRKK